MRYKHLSGVAMLALAGAASPVLAQSAPDAATPASAAGGDGEGSPIVVYGRGETRQVQTVTAVDIKAATPGTSPLKVLEKLPSVSVQSANALGTNEWSTRFSVRSFSQNQLGFTLDGVPLGDMSYGNFNGLHISRAIASENIGSSTLAQGSGALDTPSSSNLGGTVQFFSQTPTDDFGVDTQASYGSENAYRLFGRLNTGDLGGGVKAYVSGSWLDAPKWKGEGKQQAWSVNSKIVVPLGTSAKLTAFANYSDFKDDDYMDMSPALIQKYGWNWDYIRNDYKTALAIAKNLQSDLVNYSKYCANYAGYSQTICADDTYYNGYGLRKDFLAGASLTADLGSGLSLRISPYYHHNKGIGTWWTPYTPTPGGAALSIRSTSYKIARGGLTGALTYKIGTNELELGGWYESNKYTTARQFFPLADSTTSSIDNREWPQNPFYTQYKYNFKITTAQFFVQDTFQATDSLKINAGFKGISVIVDNQYDPASQSSAAARDTSGRLKARDLFLPQAGVNYTFNPQVEAFLSYAENMRAFTTDPFMTNQAGFQAIKNTIKPETSKTVEGGLRFHLDHFEGSIAGYHVKFENRLLSVQPCAIIVGCATVLSNVGSVTTNGVELAGTYHLTRALSLYGSYSYTDARYDDDVLSGVLYPTKNKQVATVPAHLANAEIAYDDGVISGRIGANYQSKRYYTYTNDASVPGRVLVDVSLGYHFDAADGPLHNLEIQGNVTNLFDKKYIATLGENGLAFTDPGGTLQSMLVGAPRQASITLRKRF
ncbi:UNVERIFIED_ORG: iron complex outermembrane receptor protein [Sphingomonas sp. R1F5B]